MNITLDTSIIAAGFNNSFAVERRTRVDDGQGGWVITYAETEDSPIRGRIRPANSNERMVADSEERQITHVLYTLQGEDIARGDRVTVQGGGLTVEILGIREPSEAGHHWEIDCLEKQYEETEGLEGS